MASPVADSYSTTSGQPLAGGRFRFPANARIHIWGQSNGVGYAPVSGLSSSPLSSDAGLAMFASGTFSRVYIWSSGSYHQLQIGTNNQGNNSTSFGPEFGLAVRWMRETTTGNLYIHKETVGGTSITLWDPANWQYAAMVGRVNSADAALAGSGITVTDIGFLWVQGESDAAQTQSWYQTRLEAILTAIETDGVVTSTSKRILEKMNPSTATYGAGVDAAKVAIAAANPSNTTAPVMPYYMIADNIHLNARGQVQMAYDAFETIFNVGHIST